VSARWGRPVPATGPIRQPVHWLCGAILWLSGWKIRGDWPPAPKAVVVCAPHTSNWDGIWMLLAGGYFRITLKWMGKASLTQGPFGFIVKALGCVPVDRSARHDMVTQMADAFAARDAMLLAIPPEGTRDLRAEWKSGFYHIAHRAHVPIIIAMLDYGTRTIEIVDMFHPSGDYAGEIGRIRGYYARAVGKHKDKFAAGG